MISRLRQNRYRALFAWLALAAVLMRSIIPAGFMPVHAGGSGQHGIQLAICHVQSHAFQANPPVGTQAQPDECPFALAAVAAIPPASLVLKPIASVRSAPADDIVVSADDRRVREHPPARAPPLLS